jgi:hypothetical protein
MTKGLPRSRSRGKPALDTVNKMVLKPRALAISVAAVSTAVGWGTAVLGDFPEGNILVLGVLANLQFTATGTNATTTFDGDWSIGTTPTADATLSGTDVNLIASTALGAATARVSPAQRAALATPAMFDNTDGSLEINLNFLIDAANITDDTTVPVTATGEVYILYSVLGDD